MHAAVADRELESEDPEIEVHLIDPIHLYRPHVSAFFSDHAWWVAILA